MAIASKVKTTTSATIDGKPMIGGAQASKDMTAEEAARRLILQGAKDRTSAADRAADKFRGLEGSERARASQAAGQLMAQATGGATGGAALAAGQAAGRQAASQYSEIAGRAAKDIFAAESAAGERRMDEAEVMKGTTLTGERAEKISLINSNFIALRQAIEDDAINEEQARSRLQAMLVGESDPEVRAVIMSSIAQIED